MGPTIPKEMKYNLHYGDVRGDVLPPPHGTNTSCSVAKQMPKAVLNVPVRELIIFLLQIRDVKYQFVLNILIILAY